MNPPNHGLACSVLLLSSPIWVVSSAFASPVNRTSNTPPSTSSVVVRADIFHPTMEATSSKSISLLKQLSSLSPGANAPGDRSFFQENFTAPTQLAISKIKTGQLKTDVTRAAPSYRAADLGNLNPLQQSPTPVNTNLSTLRLYDSPLLANKELASDDVDLGNIRVQQVQQSPAPLLQEPGNVPFQAPSPPVAPCSDPDPDLGCLPFTPLVAPPPPPPPFVYLISRIDYFRSSNILSGVDPINDGFLRPGLTLFVAPALGPNTFFIGSATGNLVRYSTQSRINYNELNFEASVLQRLSPVMFGKIGWNNQQLFIASNDLPGLSRGTRFLNDNAIRLELSRQDKLGGRFSLYTFYQLRLGFARPAERSRVINSVVASLTYDIQPSVLQLGLDYQFALATFTQQKREDQYQQIGLRLTYTTFRTIQINLFAGYSYGRSSDRAVDFTGLVLGITVGANLALF